MVDITPELKRIGVFDGIKWWNSFEDWTELTDNSVTVRFNTVQLLKAMASLPDNAGWDTFVEAISQAKYFKDN